MMTCDEVRERIEAAAHRPDFEEEIEGAEAEHLLGCVECQRWLEAERELVREIHAGLSPAAGRRIPVDLASLAGAPPHRGAAWPWRIAAAGLIAVLAFSAGRAGRPVPELPPKIASLPPERPSLEWIPVSYRSEMDRIQSSVGKVRDGLTRLSSVDPEVRAVLSAEADAVEMGASYVPILCTLARMKRGAAAAPVDLSTTHKLLMELDGIRNQKVGSYLIHQRDLSAQEVKHLLGVEIRVDSGNPSAVVVTMESTIDTGEPLNLEQWIRVVDLQAGRLEKSVAALEGP